MKMGTMAVCLPVLIVISTLGLTSGLPSGAPPAACSTLTPEHIDVPPRSCDGCGFNLSLLVADSEPNSRTYRCGENHTVVLESSTNSTFRGFLVQSRASTEEFSPEARFLGVFRAEIPSVQLLQCGEVPGSSVTHVTNNDKSSVAFTWIAPLSAEVVTFWYTVVVNFGEIYVQLSETFFPDERSCIILLTIPPPAQFSLPSGPLAVREGDSVSVCVFKQGVTEQASSVRLFTTVTNNTQHRALVSDDYEHLDIVLQFGPEDFVMCAEINTTIDLILEETEQFSVALELDSQLIATVTVEIINNFQCVGDNEFLCEGEPLCLPQEYVCDGIPDCLYKQDEFFCDNDPCTNEGSLRLRGGPTNREGLMELCYEGQFRSICINRVSVPNATFVCRELGFSGGGVWVNAWDEYKTVGSGAQLEECRVNETESTVNCTYSVDPERCDHLDDAGLRCQVQPACVHGSVRLVGGTERDGAVQVCVFGVWGPLSSYNWRFREARVVCRALGYDEFGALPIPRFPYSNVSDDDMVFSNSVNCDGSESSLLNCSLNLQVDATTYDGYIVGVHCEDLPPVSVCTSGDVRLRERDSEAWGLVEVCSGRNWVSVCSRGWDLAEATVVCRQLNRTIGCGWVYGTTKQEVQKVQYQYKYTMFGNMHYLVGRENEIYFEQSENQLGGLEFLRCTGNESNLLQCLQVGPLELKRQSSCSAGLLAGVRCSEIPKIIPSPPTRSGNYTFEVGRDTERFIQCLLPINRHFSPNSNFTAYRVTEGNKLILLDTAGGSSIVTVFSRDAPSPEDTGTYLCRAENEVGSTNFTININVLIPSGPSSRVYIRLSLPRSVDRLMILFQHENVQEVLDAMEPFLVSALDPQTKTPGQQVTHCRTANRTLDDELRKRDRYECTLDNYPPLQDSPTALAETVASFLEAQNFAISAINISSLGFCDSEPSIYGGMWEETEAGGAFSFPCEGGRVIRVCSPDNGGQWLTPDDSQCVGSTRPPTSPSTQPPTTQPPTTPTTPTEFNCTSENLSLPLDRVCDGVGHCLLLDDEFQCPSEVTGCTNGEVRLTQGISGSDGIVELCMGGVWGGLCQQTFSVENAAVVCRQLGLPRGVVPLINVQSLVPVHPVNFACSGSETNLGQCSSSALENLKCAVNFSRAAIKCQAPAQCVDGQLRLMGGADKREGNLQICFNEVWGSVCHNQGDFSIDEARVSCNQLNYNPSGALVLPDGYLTYDPNLTPFIRRIDCPTGNESQLIDCEYGSDSGANRCRPVQIRCDAYPTENCVHGSVRLRDRSHRSEGVLELCVDGQWGTVCSSVFSQIEAQVMCKQLGFRPEEPISYGAEKTRGGMLHSTFLMCTGNESSFMECEFLPLDECLQGSPTYILCSSSPSLYLSPPPPSGEDNTYFVESGQQIEVECRTERTFPSTSTIGYRTGSGSPESCTSEFSSDYRVVDTAASPDIEGHYQCVSCNAIGVRTVNFTIAILQPQGEGSSVFLRLSVPVLERLSVIVQTEIEEDERLPGLESLISSTEVISEADGTQTIECRLVSRTPADIDSQRDRYECNITTYPPTDTGVQLVERMANEIRRENIAITSAFLTSATGFCDSEVDETDWGTYVWPETIGGSRVTLTCVEDTSISVTRDCQAGGRWEMAAYGGCALRGLTEVSPDEDFGETSAVVAMAVQDAEQTDENVRFITQYLLDRVDVVLNNASLVDEEFVGNVIDVLDELQEWPEGALQSEDNGARIVRSFEIITLSLTQQENFTELEVEGENIAVRIENVNIGNINAGRSLGVSEGDDVLNVTVGDESTLAPDQIASGFLPLSLFQLAGSKQSEAEPVPVVFAIFRNSSLFSIRRNQERSPNVTVGSPVVSLTVGLNKPFVNLPDPVIINVRLQEENFINPRCVSYDFNLQEWVTDGCTTEYTPGSNQITCQCDHLTNFASLVDICSRTEKDGCGQTKDTKLALDVISITGVILSGIGLILTIVTLLIFKKLRSRDASKFHVQLSLALLGMLVVFVVGIDSSEVFEGCVTVSVLIHYFTLVAVMWMGAEALLMFQKLVIVFVQITTRYIIIVSLVCWLVPIIFAVIPAAIDPNLVITDTDTDKFCFIGDVRVFFAAFLGPIFAVLFFNLIIYVIVIVVLIKHTRNKLGKSVSDKKQRKTNIRLAISLFGVMILFGLTWVLGAFTISAASLVFQFLFAFSNSLQGFFIFVFFCLLSPDVRQLWLETFTCGRYVKSKSSSTSGAKRGYNTGQLRSGAKQSNPSTGSSGLSSLPTGQYASESSTGIELSENPSSTVLGNDHFSTAPSGNGEQSVSQNKLPRVVGPPTSSHAHFYKNPSVAEEQGAETSGLGAYESSTVVSVGFKDDFRYKR